MLIGNFTIFKNASGLYGFLNKFGIKQSVIIFFAGRLGVGHGVFPSNPSVFLSLFRRAILLNNDWRLD
jgi:hypothetical protein